MKILAQDPWLALIGIGEDSLLSLTAYALLKTANVVLGDKRHLSRLANVIPKTVKCFPWINLAETITNIKTYRGQRLIILTSGDPMLYGVGSTLTHYFPISEMIIVPQVSAFSLAASRLCWSLQEVKTLTLHGRPLESLLWYLNPGARLLILSEDRYTPARAAALLVAYGFSRSKMAVLENISSATEKLVYCCANQWCNQKVSDFNVLAIECTTDSSPKTFGQVPGLPDCMYLHDSQITKREIRAITLATLSPHPGELLWDIGAGSGSIAIEWLRAYSTMKAIAIEQDTVRATNIASNAVRLQVPHLQVVQAKAPACLPYLFGQPEAVFIGGGVLTPDLLTTCWKTLPTGGRMVANAVTIEAEMCLMNWWSKFGGSLTRLEIKRLHPVGHLTGWKALMPVTQYYVEK